MATAVSDYVPEPDIFHDVFGHVPLHANRVFADFLQRFGRAAAAATSDAANALGPACERRPFAAAAVFAQPFAIDRLQDVLFVIDSFDELSAALPT